MPSSNERSGKPGHLESGTAKRGTCPVVESGEDVDPFPPEERLVAFFLRLPDPVDLPEGLSLLLLNGTQPEVAFPGLPELSTNEPLPSHLAGADFVSVRIWQMTRPSATWPDYFELLGHTMRRALPRRVHRMRRPRSTPYDSEITIVEAVTLLPHRSRTTVSDRASAAFERCFERLSLLIRAYRVSQYVSMPTLSRERLPTVVPFLTRGLESDGQWDKKSSLMFLHQNVDDRFIPPYGPGTGLVGLIDASQKMAVGHPLFANRERLKDAQVAFTRTGDYLTSVIMAQTAVEVLLDGLLSMLMWEKGVSPEHANTEAFSEGFSKRVRTHFGRRLGGNWSPKGNSAIGEWFQFLLPLRGRVVHASYVPSRAEAHRAVEVFHHVEDFVLHRLAEKRLVYPVTALLILGEIWFRDRGMWKGQIRRLAATYREEDELHSYLHWRQDLDELRQ